MPRPDDEFINQFRARFGDLLLSGNAASGVKITHVDPRDSILPASYANDKELTDPMWINEATPGRTLRLESGPIENVNFHAFNSFSPNISSKDREAFDDRNLLGSGAVFHNKAGDLHSPMVRWNSNFSPLLDESIHCVPQISWNGTDCFTPLAESQRWLSDNPYFGLTDDISGILMHHHSEYTTGDGVDQETLTDGFSKQPDSKFALVKSEAHVNEDWPCSDREKYVLAPRNAIYTFYSFSSQISLPCYAASPNSNSLAYQ